MTDLSEYLNDPERNLLCDLLLAHLGLDRSTVGYRRLRNAVLLLSRDACDDKTVFDELAKIECASTEQIESDIATTLSKLSKPADELFNEHYAVRCKGERVKYMKRKLGTADTLSFYATVLLYLTIDGYNDIRMFDN